MKKVIMMCTTALLVGCNTATDVEQQVNELIETSRLDKPFTTVTLMKKIVPEYISKNSIYEQLDPQ